MKEMETMTLAVETCPMKNITSVSPQSSLVKALAILEMFNTSTSMAIFFDYYRG